MPTIIPDNSYQSFQRPLAELESTLKEDARRLEKNREQRVADLEGNYRSGMAKRETEMQRAAEDIREYSNEQIDSARAEARSEVDQMKSKLYDRSGRLGTEAAELQQRARDQVASLEDSHRHEISQLQHSSDTSLADQQRAAARKAEVNANRERDSRTEESRQLRDQLKDVSSTHRDFLHGQAEARQSVIQEQENDWRARTQNLMESYNREIDDFKRAADADAKHVVRAGQEAIRDKDIFFTKIIQNQDAEHSLDRTQLNDSFSKNLQDLKTLNQKERVATQARSEKVLDSMAQRNEHSMEVQADAFRDTMQQQNRKNEEKIGQLSRSLQDSRTSPDPAKVAPAAEARLRETIAGQYEKQFGADRERTKNTIDSIHHNVSQRMRDAIGQEQGRSMDMQRRNMTDLQMERALFTDHVRDVEFNRDQALHTQTGEHGREVEIMNRLHAGLLDKQRREYEDLLSGVKNDASAKMNAVRQELEFSLKMQARASAARENGIIRDFSKKLSDQKSDMQAVIDQTKAQADATVRDAERKNRQELETQTRTYDQRLAQIEFQHKERERLINDNYQDQVEKLKRSNALLIQKKS